MTSNQVRLATMIVQIANALVIILPQVFSSLPKVPVTVSAASIAIVAAIGHYAQSLVTPNTNANTPDHLPDSPQPPTTGSST
jgi:hypothetical protein